MFLLPVGAVPPGPTPASMHNAKYVRRTTVLVLGNHVTRDACRHGGLTELGDAGATEFEGMAASMHKTPQALRLYVKRSRLPVAVYQPTACHVPSRMTNAMPSAQMAKPITTKAIAAQFSTLRIIMRPSSARAGLRSLRAGFALVEIFQRQALHQIGHRPVLCLGLALEPLIVRRSRPASDGKHLRRRGEVPPRLKLVVGAGDPRRDRRGTALHRRDGRQGPRGSRRRSPPSCSRAAATRRRRRQCLLPCAGRVSR